MLKQFAVELLNAFCCVHPSLGLCVRLLDLAICFIIIYYASCFGSCLDLLLVISLSPSLGSSARFVSSSLVPLKGFGFSWLDDVSVLCENYKANISNNKHN